MRGVPGTLLVVCECLEQCYVKTVARSFVIMETDALSNDGRWSNTLMETLPAFPDGLAFSVAALRSQGGHGKYHATRPVWACRFITGPIFRNNIHIVKANRITNRVTSRKASKIENCIANEITNRIENWIENRRASKMDIFLPLYELKLCRNI